MLVPIGTPGKGLGSTTTAGLGAATGLAPPSSPSGSRPGLGCGLVPGRLFTPHTFLAKKASRRCVSLENTESHSHTRAGPGPSLVSRARGQGLHNARGAAGTKSQASSVVWGLSHRLPEAFLKGKDWQLPCGWGQAGHRKAKPSARSWERPLWLPADEVPEAACPPASGSAGAPRTRVLAG